MEAIGSLEKVTDAPGIKNENASERTSENADAHIVFSGPQKCIIIIDLENIEAPSSLWFRI